MCRVCSQHGQALLALNIYEWMRTKVAEGGGGLRPTVYTYTAAMRAALAGNLIDRALEVCIMRTLEGKHSATACLQGTLQIQSSRAQKFSVNTPQNQPCCGLF